MKASELLRTLQKQQGSWREDFNLTVNGENVTNAIVYDDKGTVDLKADIPVEDLEDDEMSPEEREAQLLYDFIHYMIEYGVINKKQFITAFNTCYIDDREPKNKLERAVQSIQLDYQHDIREITFNRVKDYFKQ